MSYKWLLMESTVDILEDGDLREHTFDLVGKKLHLIRGVNKVDGIELTDAGADETGWYRILAVSDDCDWFGRETVGKWVYLPEFSVGVSYAVGPGERIVRESWFNQPGGPPLAVFEEMK